MLAAPTLTHDRPIRWTLRFDGQNFHLELYGSSASDRIPQIPYFMAESYAPDSYSGFLNRQPGVSRSEKTA